MGRFSPPILEEFEIPSSGKTFINKVKDYNLITLMGDKGLHGFYLENSINIYSLNLLTIKESEWNSLREELDPNKKTIIVTGDNVLMDRHDSLVYIAQKLGLKEAFYLYSTGTESIRNHRPARNRV